MCRHCPERTAIYATVVVGCWPRVLQAYQALTTAPTGAKQVNACEIGKVVWTDLFVNVMYNVPTLPRANGNIRHGRSRLLATRLAGLPGADNCPNWRKANERVRNW